MLRFIKDHNEKGQCAEKLALNYLKTQGLIPIMENFSCKCGEIDLIMQDADYLVFVEVRYRKKIQYGHPFETITRSKQKKIINAIQFFLIKHPQYQHTACRIDAIAINSQTSANSESIEWVKNAIQA